LRWFHNTQSLAVLTPSRKEKKRWFEKTRMRKSDAPLYRRKKSPAGVAGGAESEAIEIIVC
jgi:hypothetical protein